MTWKIGCQSTQRSTLHCTAVEKDNCLIFLEHFKYPTFLIVMVWNTENKYFVLLDLHTNMFQ